MDDMLARLTNTEAYYRTGNPRQVVHIIDRAVAYQISAFFHEAANDSFNEKERDVQQEYKYMLRNLRQRAMTIDAQAQWIPEDRREAVVPLLYVFNVLNAGSAFAIRKRHK